MTLESLSLDVRSSPGSSGRGTCVRSPTRVSRRAVVVVLSPFT